MSNRLNPFSRCMALREFVGGKPHKRSGAGRRRGIAQGAGRRRSKKLALGGEQGKLSAGVVGTSASAVRLLTVNCAHLKGNGDEGIPQECLEAWRAGISRFCE